MLKKGIYRTKDPGLTFEEHGGGKLKHHIYWYLCFYLPERKVGMYGSSDKAHFRPYFENTIVLEGELTHLTEHLISFFIKNPDTGFNINFEGKIEGTQLHLKYCHENSPGEIYEDVFNYLEAGRLNQEG